MTAQHLPRDRAAKQWIERTRSNDEKKFAQVLPTNTRTAQTTKALVHNFYVFRPIYTELPGVAANDSLFVLLGLVILRSCTATSGRNKTNKESCAATPGRNKTNKESCAATSGRNKTNIESCSATTGNSSV